MPAERARESAGPPPWPTFTHRLGLPRPATRKAGFSRGGKEKKTRNYIIRSQEKEKKNAESWRYVKRGEFPRLTEKYNQKHIIIWPKFL